MIRSIPIYKSVPILVSRGERKEVKVVGGGKSHTGRPPNLLTVSPFASLDAYPSKTSVSV